MRNLYPSDISREKFEKIRPILESSRKKTKPRKLDLYDVFCGVLYVLKSACQWSKGVSKMGAIVTTILRSGVKNQMQIKKVFWQWRQLKEKYQ